MSFAGAWPALALALAATAEAGATATVYVTSDLRGFVEPCGCSEAMRGGIGRAAYEIAQAKKGSAVALVDAGDALFGRPKLSLAELPQAKRKAQALAEAFLAMGLVTRAVGELDDAAGTGFRRSLGLPDQRDGTAKLLTLSGHKVAVVVGQSPQDLAGPAESARRQGAEFVLGLLHDTAEHALALPERTPVDVVVASHADGPSSGEESRWTRGAAGVAQVQSKGRSLLRIDLVFDGNGRFEPQSTREDLERELKSLDERIELLKKQVNAPSLKPELKAMYEAKVAEVVARRARKAAAPPAAPSGKNTYAARFIPLESALPEDPTVAKRVAAYDQDTERLNLAWAKAHGAPCPAPQRGEPAFVGNEGCRDCHAEAFATWDASKHSHAYETLVKAGKNYHLDCVRCHVTGYQAAGGVCRVDQVEGRRGVGCESCHGPGSLHAEDPTRDNVVSKPGEQVCVSCHDKENSTHFSFSLYLPEILGAGHGKP